MKKGKVMHACRHAPLSWVSKIFGKT
jgi:hypothetical protein